MLEGEEKDKVGREEGGGRREEGRGRREEGFTREREVNGSVRLKEDQGTQRRGRKGERGEQR
jgi:hypothetical protein